MICHLPLGIDIIHAIQAHRSVFWDHIFLFLNYFDTQVFAFTLIPVIWLGYKRQQGIHIFYLLLASTWVNTILKSVFDCPRPFEVDPSVLVLIVGGDSFPSGAAQTSFLLGALLMYSFRKWWSWLIGINYIVWIGFSRMYLGVHFPIDILGGWTVGLVLFLLDIWLFPKLKELFHAKTAFFNLMASQFLPLIGFVLLPSKFMSIIFFALIVVGWGIYISDVKKIFVPFSRSIIVISLRIVLAVGGVFILFAILEKLFHSRYLNALALGLWISVIAPWLCKKLPFLQSRA